MDLTEAYKKAKPMYTGRLRHTFIVLHDDPEDEQVEPVVTNSNRVPIRGKRTGSPVTSASKKPNF